MLKKPLNQKTFASLHNFCVNLLFNRIMKKVFSILIALLIILSGVHLTFATHYCGGILAATGINFSGGQVTCGMEKHEEHVFAGETVLSSHCCENVVTVYSVDPNYTPSAIRCDRLCTTQLSIFAIPASAIISNPSFHPVLLTDYGPPGTYQYNAVSLPDICIFRI
jgi:hypothetical protein